MTAITRPVLRYHGGKFGNHGSVAKHIASLLPPHRVYVEPFGGAASVLMVKPRSYAEVYNDRWDGVVNVFRVLRDPDQAAELERRLRLTPFARSEFALCTAETLADISCPIERARLTMLRSFAGFGSAASNPNYNTGFRSTAKRSGTTPAHDWHNYPDCIPFFTARLSGCVIENRPAAQVIQAHDGPGTLHYVDPPYVHDTRRLKKRKQTSEYVFEMTDDDHRALAAVLHQAEGMVVLSGYAGDLYDDLYGTWHQETFNTRADGAKARTEVLWFNAAARAARDSGGLFP